MLVYLCIYIIQYGFRPCMHARPYTAVSRKIVLQERKSVRENTENCYMTRTAPSAISLESHRKKGPV